MKLHDLISTETSKNLPNPDIENVTSNINNIFQSTLFVLYRGINFDTQRIINNILQRRPAAIVCEKQIELNTDIPVIRVRSARAELANICSRFYEIDYDKADFIGITGTNGKTSTATMLYEILKISGERVGFIGTGKIICHDEVLSSDGYSMTTPDPELLYRSIAIMLKKGCTKIVMEVSSHALELEKVAPIKFKCAIFTNLSNEHLDFHKDMSSYYAAKLKLFNQNEIGIFNADDEYSKRAIVDSPDSCKKYSVGIYGSADVNAINISYDGLVGTSYIYKEAGLIFKARLSLGAEHNVYNSMMALKCAILLGIKPCVAKFALENLKAIDGRLEIISSEITVIIDYAHTPTAFTNILKTVKLSKKSGQKLITVFGCGGDRDSKKRPLMAAEAEKYSDIIYVTEDNSRTECKTKIISDILLGLKDEKKRRVILSRKAAITRAILEADIGDTVLILGKGHERYNIDKYGYHPFNEREVVSAALEKRGEIERT